MEIREQLQRSFGHAYTLERELGGGGISQVFSVQQALTMYDPNRRADWRDPFIIPEFSKRLGEACEKRGDRVKAAEHYRKVINLRKNADPELQVIVEELKSRVRRLSDLETIPR